MDIPREHYFDIIVIGAGAAGLNVASFFNSIGVRVLLIDRSDERIGGDCLNFGCIPSKALLHAAHTVSAAKDAAAYGLTFAGDVQWSAIVAEIQAKQNRIREHENTEYFRSKGMTVVLGEATFTGINTVSVNGEQYYGRHIVIATGSRPRELSVPGVAQVRVVNNETVFTMPALPKRLLIVGAGPIGIEMAQAFSELGVAVTVIDPASEILGKEDPELAGALRRQLEMKGVRFLLEHTLKSFSGASEARATYHDTEVIINFDVVLASIGRVVDIRALKPEQAGIKIDERGIPILNTYLQTSNRRVFVCGDAVGQHQFTHAAELHAGIIIRNLLVPIFKKPLNTDGMAWVTYTYPELATFGLSEAALKTRSIAYEVLRVNLSDDDRSITAGARGMAKLFIDAKKRIRGGTVLAPRAGELIAELSLAQQQKLKTTNLFSKVYPYPTFARINKHLATIPARTQLTPFLQAVLRLLYRL